MNKSEFKSQINSIDIEIHLNRKQLARIYLEIRNILIRLLKGIINVQKISLIIPRNLNEVIHDYSNSISNKLIVYFKDPSLAPHLRPYEKLYESTGTKEIEDVKYGALNLIYSGFNKILSDNGIITEYTTEPNSLIRNNYLDTLSQNKYQLSDLLFELIETYSAEYHN